MRVELRPGESQEQLLKRFRKQVQREKILSEVRKRRWYVTKGEKERLAKAKAIRKARRKARKAEERRAQGY
ncbi:MAG: 30S ribosomal protein S21 [Anaerolineae bacterium]|jgi:small subunit ribosomal protein S21